jgi:hypothetical protein
MSNYMPENYSIERRPVFSHSVDSVALPTGIKPVGFPLDTMGAAEVGKDGEKKGSFTQRPLLPAASSQLSHDDQMLLSEMVGMVFDTGVQDSSGNFTAIQDPDDDFTPQGDTDSNSSGDYLAMLAKAFTGAFAAMHKGVITQMQSYSELQKLNQTQTQSVLQSTTNSMNELDALNKKQAELSAFQAQMESSFSTISDVMTGVQIGLLILSVASCFFTGGATLAFLPEVFSTVLSPAVQIALKLGIGALVASPMLMKGIMSFCVSTKLNDLASTQQLVGSALGGSQTNNLFYRFLQQVTQRDGGVLQEEVSGSNDVVDTFATITNAYRQISFGLADAV